MTTDKEGRHFHEELADVRSRLLEMAAMAEELVRRAVEAVMERDIEKAESVILGDRELDAMEVALDEAGVNLLALHQPFARDLRMIMMILRIANDLERVGDHAVNIAETVEHLEGRPPVERFPQLEEIARVAREMLSDALDAFVREDPDAAHEVCKRDDRADALHESLFRTLLTHMMEDPRRIGSSMSMILVSRNLERVADLATNVAEDVIYLVEGRIIKHGGAREGSAEQDEDGEGGPDRVSGHLI
jgi:phosphate transport system protein